MTRPFFAVALACFFLLFTGCREDAVISRTDIQFLQQGILVTHWSDEDHYSKYTEQLDSLYINQGEQVLFTAGYAINGNAISSDSAMNLYSSHYWELEGESINSTTIESRFDSVGYRFTVLNTIDFSGDTLRDTLHIFVGSPLDITLVTPTSDAHIEPLSDDYIELNWDISGIDPWESSECAVYAVVAEGVSLSKSTHWLDILDSVNALSIGDCKNGMRLKGPLISEKWLQMNGLDLKDTSLMVYWGVKATAFTENGFEELAKDASSFSTKFIGRKNSVIQIKPIYEGLTPGSSISTKIVLVNASGDTLKTIPYTDTSKPKSINIQPQSGLQIYPYESKLTDYEAKPIVIDVPERSMLRLGDSIVFTDKIPPKAAPVKSAFALTDSIRFYFMDNGSGINPTQKKFVLADYDTINAVYEQSILSFVNPCRRECKIKIPIPDNARNRNAELFWRMVPNKDSLRITGPFVQMEEQQ